ncbi:MAG: glycoside hydrolase family 127 protein, partial [Acidobacteria bacterium]|nr:glycoside hydrolase family 127 protein [Acidobacteriota bacterium]
MSISRRQFISTAALSPLARAASSKIQLQAQPFRLDQVRLLPGPAEASMQLNRKYLHDLEADRLVHMFKVTAGLPSPARQFGGWESTELRGHFPGHYLSACALMFAGAGDRDLKAKGEAMVEELAKCQKANGTG